MTYVILTLSISPLREGKIFCSELGFATSDKASWSERIRAQFRDSKNMRKIPWSIRKYSESLFHVLKLHNLPPLFSNFIFYCASKWQLIAQNVRIAFCGNGFIHLNIPEIYEGDIGGQKKCAPIADQGSKWAIFVPSAEIMLKIIKKSINARSITLASRNRDECNAILTLN